MNLKLEHYFQLQLAYNIRTTAQKWAYLVTLSTYIVDYLLHS